MDLDNVSPISVLSPAQAGYVSAIEEAVSDLAGDGSPFLTSVLYAGNGPVLAEYDGNESLVIEQARAIPAVSIIADAAALATSSE